MPYQCYIKTYFFLREIIFETFTSNNDFPADENIKNKPDNVYLKVINRIIDKQLAKIIENYIQLLFERLTYSQLKEQNLSYRIPEIIYSYSPTGGFTFVSNAMQKLLGIGPDKFTGQDIYFWLGYVYPDDREKVLTHFNAQLADKNEAEYEYRMLGATNHIHHVINRSASILDEHGEIISIDGIIIDISDIKNMERQLRARNNQLEYMTNELRKANQRLLEIDQRKSELVKIVAHDLRNPLNSMRLFIEMLLMYKNSPQEYEDFLHKIDQESIRLIDLINDFLDTKKIESGHMYFRQKPVDLTGLIDYFITIYRWEAKKKDITLSVDNMDNIPKVIGDKQRISQVFSNLLANALRFTPEGGVIKITTRPVVGTRKSDPDLASYLESQTNYIKVGIQDNGPGINPKYHQKIFEKLFQIGSQTSTNNQGTGLGLAIAKEIAEGHGGRIWVESELSKGTTFYFTLPVEN